MAALTSPGRARGPPCTPERRERVVKCRLPVGREVWNVEQSMRRAALATLVAVTLLLAGCGVDVTSGTSSGTSPNGDVVGARATPGGASSTTTPVLPAPPADIEVIDDDGSAPNRTAAAALADLQRWWSTQYPEVFGGRYEPVEGGYYAIDSGSDPETVPCSPRRIDQVLENAYYCPEDDAVVWDQEGLMPRLAREYGAFTVAVVLAHEWGHAMQVRADVELPAVTVELQADCLAGAWVRHVVDDGDSGFAVTTEQLDDSLNGILALRDAPGSLATDANAHGSGFDRVGAFQDGYEGSAETCAAYTADNPQPFQFPLSADEYATQGDMPLESAGPDDPGINSQAFISLDKFWAQTFPTVSGGDAWKPMQSPVPFDPASPPTCNGKSVGGYRLFLCVPERYVAFDDVDTIPQVYDQGGDFAVATLYATQYGLEVQHQLGLDTSNEVTSTLRGDCYAGAWAAAIIPGQAFDTSDEGLSLSAGDLDEAVGVLLTFRTDDDRKRQGPGFQRVTAFRRGVLKGASSCRTVGS